MGKKINVGVIFGGRSSEHEVSLASATSVINALDKEKYNIILIGISKEGKWLSSDKTLGMLKERENNIHDNEKIILPDPGKKSLVEIRNNSSNTSDKLDVIFPVLHGLYGEDGTIQGLLELADIPYIGAGVLASAVGMDKIIQKNLFLQANLPVADFTWFYFSQYSKEPENYIDSIERTLGYPCFVKPANSGSSVGINKSHDRNELIKNIEESSKFDLKILIEEYITNAREVECSVLGNEAPIASVPGEIIPSNEFYDYDSKYIDGKSKSIIPANIPDEIKNTIQEYAIKAYKCIDCSGMARVDFFVRKTDYVVILNEINTIPGFTNISMYPKLWEASGINYSVLLDKLIELAISRHKEKSNLRTSYKPKLKWY